MDPNTIIRIHTTSVMLFLLTYLIKTILLFTNKQALEKYARATKVPEMIISVLFLVTGIWLYTIIGGIKAPHIIKLVLVLLSIPIAIVAFKKQKKGLAFLSLLMIVGAYGVAEMSRAKPFIASGATSSDHGEQIYLQNCVFCHGVNGKKMYRNASDLTASVLDGTTISSVVREGRDGKGKMPSYKVVLSDDDIKSVAEYVTSLEAHPTALR